MASSTYQIVDINQWMNGWNNEEVLNGESDDDGTKHSRGILPMVDLRSYEDFAKQHIALHRAESCDERHEKRHEIMLHNDNVPIINLPLSILLSGERSCELPPRHLEFAILIPRQYTQPFLNNDEEDCCIHELFFASQSKSTLQSRKPWLVRQVLIDSDEFWHEARKIRLVQDCNDKGSTTGRDFHPFQSLPRLWKPDPLVSSYVLPLLKEWITEKRECHDSIEKNKQQIKTNNAGVVLDLGSGAGRDICYLAEEVKQFQHALLRKDDKQVIHSVHFVGIDNHKGSAKRCIPLWRNRGVDVMTHSALLDLNKLHLVREHFMDTSKLLTRQPMKQTSGIICIFAIRFLNRKLLSYIANSQNFVDDDDKSTSTPPKAKTAIHSPPPTLVLPIGTILAISHFCKPKEGSTWAFDHPKESSVLDRWELKNLFDERRWKIMRDNLILDGDHGRTLIQFIAKKIA